MSFKTGLLIALTLTISACSTIHFDRFSATTDGKNTHQQWHHNFALALYEGSSPVNLVVRRQLG
uniref:hypothetical protein n=1 Tax=Rheinheimera sp. TaxID=1869214 RepID=UPI004048822A